MASIASCGSGSLTRWQSQYQWGLSPSQDFTEAEESDHHAGLCNTAACFPEQWSEKENPIQTDCGQSFIT